MNRYASREDLKSRVNIPALSTDKDALCDDILESVSRTIERWCKRWFYPATQIRYYTPAQAASMPPAYASELLVDDLLSVTELATDQDGDLVYETIWTLGADAILGPYNAPNEAPPEPYWSVHVLPYGHYRFPVWPRSTRITGSWGYYDVRTALTATLSGAINASVTALTVSDGSQVGTGNTLWLDSEQVFVSAIAGTSLTVLRGVNGTTAASHTDGAALAVQSYPLVHNACLYQAALDYVTTQGGVEAHGGPSSAPPGGGLHPFAQRMLATFSRDGIG